MTDQTSLGGRLDRLSDVLAETDERLRLGHSATHRPWPTGFVPLDTYLSGGLRPGELTLLGGPQGLGKTTMALQIARQVAAKGHPVVYVSYEHDSVSLLERVVAAEAGELAGQDGVPLRGVRSALEGEGEAGSLSDRLSSAPGGAEAIASVSVDLDRFHILRAHVDTTVDDITSAVREVIATDGGQPLVVVDYVQKVAAPEAGQDEERRMAVVAGALKDLALTGALPVLAISASDAAGIADGTRLRTQNLRGASALAYEADCVLVLNEKYDVVARHHLVYGAANADRYHHFVVLSIEKNRGGLARVDMEFRKRFEQARYERAGELVREQLVDSRLWTS
jgi:replicative DNA helicase